MDDSGLESRYGESYFLQIVQSCTAAHITSHVKDTGLFVEGAVSEA